jgi:hypothetical protein
MRELEEEEERKKMNKFITQFEDRKKKFKKKFNFIINKINILLRNKLIFYLIF